MHFFFSEIEGRKKKNIIKKRGKKKGEREKLSFEKKNVREKQ